MASTRRIGIVSIVVAFLITALIGLGLALQLRGESASISQVLVRSLIGFAVVMPLFILGTYLYVRDIQQQTLYEVGTSELEHQRALIDYIRVHRTSTFAEAALALGLTSADVQALLEELVVLQIYNGRIDWDEQVFYADELSLPAH